MEPPRSPDVWELSRFSAVDLNGPLHTVRHRFSSTTAVRLLKESLDCAGSFGAKRLLTYLHWEWSDCCTAPVSTRIALDRRW